MHESCAYLLPTPHTHGFGLLEASILRLEKTKKDPEKEIKRPTCENVKTWPTHVGVRGVFFFDNSCHVQMSIRWWWTSVRGGGTFHGVLCRIRRFLSSNTGAVYRE